VTATGDQLAWAARIWRLSPRSDRIGWYYMTTGFLDSERARAVDDWYAIDTATRKEITHTLVRLYSTMQLAQPS